MENPTFGGPFIRTLSFMICVPHSKHNLNGWDSIWKYEQQRSQKMCPHKKSIYIIYFNGVPLWVWDAWLSLTQKFTETHMRPFSFSYNENCFPFFFFSFIFLQSFWYIQTKNAILFYCLKNKLSCIFRSLKERTDSGERQSKIQKINN